MFLKAVNANVKVVFVHRRQSNSTLQRTGERACKTSRIPDAIEYSGDDIDYIQLLVSGLLSCFINEHKQTKSSGVVC